MHGVMFICSECKKETDRTMDGRCFSCWLADGKNDDKTFVSDAVVLPKKQVEKIAKETARQVMLEIEAKEVTKRNCGEAGPSDPHTLTITRAANGFIIKDNLSDISYGEVIEEEDCIDDKKAQTDAMIKLLYYIKEAFGCFGGKYDDHKVYVLDLPGQDNEKFTEEMDNVVWHRETEEEKKEACDCNSDTCNGVCDCSACDKRDTCENSKVKDGPKE